MQSCSPAYYIVFSRTDKLLDVVRFTKVNLHENIRSRAKTVIVQSKGLVVEIKSTRFERFEDIVWNRESIKSIHIPVTAPSTNKTVQYEQMLRWNTADQKSAMLLTSARQPCSAFPHPSPTNMSSNHQSTFLLPPSVSASQLESPNLLSRILGATPTTMITHATTTAQSCIPNTFLLNVVCVAAQIVANITTNVK